MKPADLAREVNLPQPTIHRIVTGQSTRPYKSSLEPIAKYFDVTSEQLLGLHPLPADQEGSQFIENNIMPNLTEGFQIIPLQRWDSLFDINVKSEGQLAVGNVSKRAFALIMQDYSMEPLFEKGSTLIFDPELTPIDHSFVLIKRIVTKSCVFRQLLIDHDQKYIKSLNPDISASSLRLIGEDDEIAACLVETRSNFHHYSQKPKELDI